MRCEHYNLAREPSWHGGAASSSFSQFACLSRTSAVRHAARSLPRAPGVSRWVPAASVPLWLVRAHEERRRLAQARRAAAGWLPSGDAAAEEVLVPEGAPPAGRHGHETTWEAASRAKALLPKRHVAA